FPQHMPEHTPEHTGGALEALSPDLASRLRFLLEADALKTILRRNSIVGGTRLENSAEHSWHLAVMALVLAPYSNEVVDIGRVVSMLLIHDIVEIDAGDTFIYDVSARLEQAAAEGAAAERLFEMFPNGHEMRALWEEFETRATPEARWLCERARAARDAELDSLFVGDHHNVPVPYYQNVPMLGRLLIEWSERPVGALFLLPLWHPVLVAEQIGTLAAIADGRFIMQ